jgi:hypothetical protein
MTAEHMVVGDIVRKCREPPGGGQCLTPQRHGGAQAVLPSEHAGEQRLEAGEHGHEQGDGSAAAELEEAVAGLALPGHPGEIAEL